MPPELGLVDRHVHTQLAYCSENMDVAKAIDLAHDFGLAGLGFAEHSGHLYFPVKQYWSGHYAEAGVGRAEARHNRVAAYRALKQRYAHPGIWFGLETDVDYAGNLVLKPDDRRDIDYVLGTIHRTPSSRVDAASPATVAEEYMALLRQLLAHHVDILAHPFRLFRHAGLPLPEHLFHPVAQLLREHGVAAELNFHNNHPPLGFVRACLERGVRFSLGSDAHNLYEVGEFADHLRLLADAGFDGVLSDVLLPPFD
jgi:putative hydrolase